MTIENFQSYLLDKGRELYRSMPWRDNTNPYWVLVSELMLQQTQVDRVRPKFEAFLTQFPSVEVLAEADPSAVITAWQGLGYNRRALYLQRAAQMIAADFKGVFPDTKEELVRLPGVGVNTAGAILAYAFDKPSEFIETNIRTVYIYHFFSPEEAVADAAILPLLKATLSDADPREVYWALMDYGSELKRSGVRVHTQSTMYKKQSPLQGSLREMRGMVISLLVAEGSVEMSELMRRFSADARIAPAVQGLEKDGLIEQREQVIYLTKQSQPGIIRT